MADEHSGSILAVDFGNVNTRAILVDLVDGMYRLIARAEARSTAGFPANDARLRIGAAVALMRYVHAKVGEKDKKDEQQEAAKKAGAGRYASSQPPVRLVT